MTAAPNHFRYGEAPQTIRAIVAVGRAIKLGFLVALAFLAIIGGASYLAVERMLHYAETMDHGAEFVAQVENIQNLTTDIETGPRGFVITGNEAFLTPYLEASSKLEMEIAALSHLAEADPVERAETAELARLSRERV